MRNVTILLAVLAMLAMASPAQAYISWDGGAGTNAWEDAANWGGDALPPTNDYVRFTGDFGDINVTINSDVTIQYINPNYYDHDNHVIELQSGSFTLTDATWWAGYNDWYHDAGQGGLSKMIVSGGAFSSPNVNIEGDASTAGSGVFKVDGSGATSIAATVKFNMMNDDSSEVEFAFGGGSDPIQEIDCADLDLEGVLRVTGTADAGTYTIFDYSGTLANSIASVVLPAGWSIDYGDGSDDEVKVTVPEPATLALLGIGGIGVLLRRRRA